MGTRVIDFIPPIVGTEGQFNTFRIGGFYAKHLTQGEEVFLMDSKAREVFGKAVVEKVEVGRLAEMCAQHAASNHTELDMPDGKNAERLMVLLQRINGPHIATPTKKTTVIYLRRLE
ncbi:hypothetical protein [Paraburkholderia sp.]|uniref:hypothetical protein n=1 Tax=Paraburkholderia sp. TaxID=1926495 RepID=UPI0039E50A11